MDQQFNAYATRAVPRYTSYPTAPHFSDNVGPANYAAWLAALDPADPVSLYLHVPFCRQVCWYCGCNMKLASKEAPILDYAATLVEEIHLLANHLPARMPVSHLHWGGGTPTALSPDALAMAMETVANRFEITADADLDIESDPRTLTAEMIQRIGALGFTRASFGVQEFDPKVQAAINRVQPPDMVRGAVDGLRAVGVGAINFDLIYGLPHQTVATLEETIRICGDMRPDRIALFGYAHVPWMAKKQRMIDEAALPGAAERVEQAQAAAEAICDAGYIPIGLDHFALPDDPLAIALQLGELRRNFQGYTTDTATALLGLGATSIGRTPQGFTQNIVETGAWARAVTAGDLPISKGLSLSDEDRLRGRVIEALMCQGRVNLGETCGDDATVARLLSEATPDLAAMAADGLIKWDGAAIAMTPSGAPLVRVVAALFDEYLQSRAAKHSVAV